MIGLDDSRNRDLVVIFRETALAGAYLIEKEAVRDDRGYFARMFCAHEFEERGLDPRVAQCSVSYNRSRGTLRGLHYQASPHDEAKTVYCISGAIWDVIVDLRPHSSTRHRWFGVEMRAEVGNGIHIPAGFAHGFMTLENDTRVQYLISTFYVPGAARGIRYDDARLAIAWPTSITTISQRDLALPNLTKLE